MPISALKTRSSQCELCSSTEGLSSFGLETKDKSGAEAAVLVCQTCHSALESNDFSNTNHWRGLNEAIWNEHTPVKVLSYKILSALKSQDWAADLLSQIYLEDEDLTWAKSLVQEESSAADAKTVDSNGTQLFEGDSVTLIKDLDVKGAGFTAKRGTLVKNIKLTDNPKHIEGKVNGIGIVLVAAYLKKVVE
jgi:protein PhnA